ncbi:MAG: hypothetical protein KFKLKKLM_02078 [Flavobacteriales bacterium]|nr:hypothetical protein [Flavobacteriales bacterium]
MFTEDFLHYIWTFKLFNTKDLNTVQNEPITILKSGQHNTDAGPDFFNAQIKIGETTWAGNVEIHINSSDWLKHQHQKDNAYNNVVLHVVYHYDVDIRNATGNHIPTIELKNLIDTKLISNYKQLIGSKNWIACSNQIKQVDQFVLQNWLERLIFERLERKSIEINQTLLLNKNDWEETFYQTLFKYFGLKVNSQPFLLLAKNTPLKIIDKHKNLLSIEALLFGQAGFLNNDVDDEYYLKLKKEYQFLSAKFNLKPLDASLWKFLRLRPANFPTLRISQLANLVAQEPRFFSKILEINSVQEFQKIFSVTVSSYWNSHYQFGNTQKINTIKRTGKIMTDGLIVNVVVSILFVYASSIQNDELKNKAIRFLEQLNTEKNTIILNFEKLGVKSKNALQSQALIELKTNYCSHKKCLNCSIGNHLLKN